MDERTVVGSAFGRIRGSADRRARAVHARLAKRRGRFRKIVGGRIMPRTAVERRAAIEAGRRLRRIARTPRARRIAARTHRWNRRHGLGESTAVRHNPLFLAAVNEVVIATGRPDIGRAIVEAIDPKLTSTPIGVLAMDAAEVLAESPQIGRSFVDVIVLDETTFAAFFEPIENVNDAALERALANFGEVDVLVRPGEDIDESTTADLYMIAVTVPSDRLEGIDVTEDAGDEDAAVIDESQSPDPEAIQSLLSHPCFARLVSD